MERSDLLETHEIPAVLANQKYKLVLADESHRDTLREPVAQFSIEVFGENHAMTEEQLQESIDGFTVSETARRLVSYELLFFLKYIYLKYKKALFIDN